MLFSYKINFKDFLPQLFAVIAGTLFAISDGITFGWTAPFIPYLNSEKSHILADQFQLDWLENGYLVGAFCGLPLTIYLVDKIGRKKSLLVAAAIEIAMWIFIAVADKIEYIIIARSITGIASNMTFVAAPMYSAEIADQKYRGFLTSIINYMALFGCLIVYSVGPYLPFYVPCVIASCVSLIGLIVFSFMPESPLYLLSKNREEEAKKALHFFKPQSDIEHEVSVIKELLKKQLADKGRALDLLLVPSNRKCILIMAYLNIFQHLSAFVVVIMNLHNILESAGELYMDSAHAAIVFVICMIIAVIIGSVQVDKFGRKTLLIVSSILCGLCLLALAVFFNLKSMNYDVRTYSWIPIVSVMVYATAFKFGLGLVPLVITAEIFPTNMKTLGMTISDSMFIIGGIIALQLYQILRNFGIFISFYLFSACAFSVTLFALYYLPETKGKSLDDIQNKLKGKSKKTININSEHCP